MDKLAVLVDLQSICQFVSNKLSLIHLFEPFRDYSLLLNTEITILKFRVSLRRDEKS